MDKVPNEALLEAGLDLMRQNEKPLSRAQAKGRAMIYRTAQGETVRVRTSNDHLLVVVPDQDAENARLNIEGTSYLLVVMPERPRTRGPVMAFLIPTAEAADAVRTAQRKWLASGPNTKGDNRAWVLRFDDSGPDTSNGFARTWAHYRLSGSASTDAYHRVPASDPAPLARGKLGQMITAAKHTIAEAAGVSPEAVRISIDLA